MSYIYLLWFVTTKLCTQFELPSDKAYFIFTGRNNKHTWGKKEEK